MVRIRITPEIAIESEELVESFARSSGPGGQHVNTTDSAVILRFDVANSTSLTDGLKRRLIGLAGTRMSKEGELILRSEGSRSQLVNRQEVRDRLFALIRRAAVAPKKRRATKPTRASQARRLDGKAKRSVIKSGRNKVLD